jgi:uncharacterized coiled-coil protein SlyX
MFDRMAQTAADSRNRAMECRAHLDATIDDLHITVGHAIQEAEVCDANTRACMTQAIDYINYLEGKVKAREDRIAELNETIARMDRVAKGE